MSTYSLILRSVKGSKLSIQEADGNLLYLEDLAMTGGATGATGPKGDTGPQGATGPAGGGSIGPSTYIPVGDGTGLTFSPLLSFDYDTTNFSEGFVNTFGECVGDSVILGGRYNTIYNNNYGSGTPSMCQSAIIGGEYNNIVSGSWHSSIIGGQCNTICCYSQNSSIIGGYCNTISDTCHSLVFGYCNELLNSRYSSILGGRYNSVTNASLYSSIIGGQFGTVSNSCNSVILGGQNLQLTNQNDTALTKHLWIAGSVSPNNGANFGINGTISVGPQIAYLCNGIIFQVV
jgi:hypothetical protein